MGDWERDLLTEQRDRARAQVAIFRRWLALVEEGECLVPYFTERRHRRVAIYGAGEAGRLLLRQFQRDGRVEVPYFLDRAAECGGERWGIPVYPPSDWGGQGDVDAVVVTVALGFGEIRRALLDIRPAIPAVSLDMVLEDREIEVWHGKQHSAV